MDPKVTPPKPSPSTQNSGILAILALGCVGAFVAGFFLSDLLKNQTQSSPPVSTGTSPTPTMSQGVTQTGSGISAVDSLSFATGLHYFDDTVLAITTDTPRKIFIGSMVRVEDEPNMYVHNTRVSFFDGETWTRKTGSARSNTSAITTSALISAWNIDIDATRVLRERVSGKAQVDTHSIQFFAPDLQNEMSVRSLPGYTKFMSEGDGTITIQGKKHAAKVLYTRIYSMNTADIQFYSEPIGVTTDWVAFWDTAGNFYHVDATSVAKPTAIYKSHTLGIHLSPSGAVSKTFSVQTTRDTNIPPDKYSISIGNPIGSTLDLTRKNAINKAPNGAYDWYLGEVEGTVSHDGQTPLSGYGVVEYIHD